MKPVLHRRQFITTSAASILGLRAAGLAESHGAPLIPSELDGLLKTIDRSLLTQTETDARAFLDARISSRIGPILLDIERFTKRMPDGSVLVSNYWGRAPLLASTFFVAHKLLGDQRYQDAGLALADHYLAIQEPEGFWHFAHFVKPDGQTTRHEVPDFKGRSVCRLQDSHQSGIFQLLLDAWCLTGQTKYLNSARKCADYVLSIQNENGRWPDYWIPGHLHNQPNPRAKAGTISGGSYNDGATSGCVGMMLVMHHLTGERKYLARLPALGDWIFKTQLGQGRVRGWCQQYDLASRPVAARHFESPVIEPRTFPRFIAPLCAWYAIMTGEERFITLMRETVAWVNAVEIPGSEGGWGYQYQPDGTAVFTLDYKVYRHDQPGTWPETFPAKHDGIQRYRRENGGPGDAPYYLKAYDERGLPGLRAVFAGSSELAEKEFTAAQLNACRQATDPKIVDMIRRHRLSLLNPQFDFDRGENEASHGRAAWDWLRKVRMAEGRFSARELAPGGKPAFAGSQLFSFKVADWFAVNLTGK